MNGCQWMTLHCNRPVLRLDWNETSRKVAEACKKGGGRMGSLHPYFEVPCETCRSVARAYSPRVVVSTHMGRAPTS